MAVEEVLARLLLDVSPTAAETVPIAQAAGRTLAEDLLARRTQPPFDTSAMDGYAVRAGDIAAPPTHIRLVGRSVAGRRFAGTLGPGEAVRIFTGAPLPEGADTILIQENARAEGETVVALQAEALGRFVRPRGLDFRDADTLLRAGTRLGARHVSLAAAMNHAALAVRAKPLVGVLATGNELVPPGASPGPDQIISSNAFAIAALVDRGGGQTLDLGIVPDREDATRDAIARAREAGADILVTLGGASVGEHDLVRQALEASGLILELWRIAMRPGKPFLYGRLEGMRVLGLPGSPVSSYVCATVFLLPLLDALNGRAAGATPERPAILGVELPPNDERQDYLRATLELRGGDLVATPFERQDSSMLSALARADALVVRPPFAPAARRGDTCAVIHLES